MRIARGQNKSTQVRVGERNEREDAEKNVEGWGEDLRSFLLTFEPEPTVGSEIPFRGLFSGYPLLLPTNDSNMRHSSRGG